MWSTSLVRIFNISLMILVSFNVYIISIGVKYSLPCAITSFSFLILIKLVIIIVIKFNTLNIKINETKRKDELFIYYPISSNNVIIRICFVLALAFDFF